MDQRRLALLEAEELEELLAPPKSGGSCGSTVSSEHSGVLQLWEREDSEQREELRRLQQQMAAAAGELRSGLLRLSKDPRLAEVSGALPQLLAQHLAQLTQSCADAMQAWEVVLL